MVGNPDYSGTAGAFDPMEFRKNTLSNCWKGRRQRTRECITRDEFDSPLQEFIIMCHRYPHEPCPTGFFPEDPEGPPNPRTACHHESVNPDVETSPDGSIQEEVQTEIETSELGTCVWADWEGWATNCGTTSWRKEVGNRFRYRRCMDLGFHEAGIVNTENKVNIPQYRQLHLCPVNERDLVQPETDAGGTVTSLYSFTCNGEQQALARSQTLTGSVNNNTSTEDLITNQNSDFAVKYCEKLYESEVVYCLKHHLNNFGGGEVSDELITKRAELAQLSNKKDYTPSN